MTTSSVGLATGAATEVARPSCVDARHGYVARAVNNHEVFVQNSFGKARPPIRLTTSCQHLETMTSFGLSTEFNCIDTGDAVVATTASVRQGCRVTKIQPYVAEAGDWPAK